MGKHNDTSKYPIKPVPALEDYFPIADTEDNLKTKNVRIEGVVSRVLLEADLPSEDTRLISVEDITVDGSEVTVTNAVYQILGEEYTVASEVLEVEPADAGYYRIDVIYADANGELTLLRGEQSQETAVQPSIPSGTILVGVLSIYGEEIQPQIPPTTDLKRKTSETWVGLYGQGTTYSVPWGYYSGLRWASGTGDLTIHSLDVTDANTAYRYDGRMFYISNATENILTLKHLSEDATGNCPFFMPDAQDILLTPGGILSFRYYAATATTGRLELASKSTTSEDLPDFFLATCISPLIFPEVAGAKIGYITDTLRPFSLEPYAPQINSNPMSVEVIGNDIFIAYNVTDVIEGVSKRRFGILKLTAYLQGNDLRVKEYQDLYIPADVVSYEAPYPTMHGEDRNEDYLFYSIASDPTVILKINRHNILDYRVSEPLFISGSLHDIQVVEDYIYMYRDMEDNTGVFYRINENLNIDTLEELFTIGGDEFSNIAQDVFCIDRNKIYVCVRNTSSTIAQAENLGIQVYSLTGRLLRENMNIPIATGQTTGYPYPHWMDIHNDKIILHTCQPGSNVRVVARIDTQTLELDGDNSIVVSPCGSLTDDNSVTPKGEVYLNSERDSSFPLERRLYYIPDYRDLSGMVEYSGMDYFSGGSTPGTTRKKTGLITKVSELDFDIPIPTAEPELATGNTVSFEALQVYNIDTPATGDILFDFTDAKRIQQKFYHNDSEAPDIPAEGVLMGTGTYVTGVLNVIIFEFVKTGRVEYWIIQEG